MGPVSLNWYRDRGLLKEGSVEPITHYSAGRIDIRDGSKEGYDGWDEYSLPPMHGEDWNDFSIWLESFQTVELWEFDDIIAKYEDATGRKIRWSTEDWKE